MPSRRKLAPIHPGEALAFDFLEAAPNTALFLGIVFRNGGFAILRSRRQKPTA